MRHFYPTWQTFPVEALAQKWDVVSFAAGAAHKRLLVAIVTLAVFNDSDVLLELSTRPQPRSRMSLSLYFLYDVTK